MTLNINEFYKINKINDIFDELSMAIQNGAYAIHGIKEQETLDIVMQSFEK